jgi:DNA invertase Pin-like site-specific DNA recombinase
MAKIKPVTDRVALYARISEDASGEEIGVARQLREARALATARGWKIVAEHKDNDISALRGKRRDGYEKVLGLVRAGSIDRVLVWQTSRLIRNRAERAEAIEEFGKARVSISAVKGPEFDLTTAYGRGQFGLLGEFDTMESEVKSERVAAAAADRARGGQPNGGLGYGWTKSFAPDGKAVYAVQEEQAVIVREIVRRLLRGESLSFVTADLNARGVPAPNGPSWGKTSVKKIATRLSNVAQRIHHRGRPDEQIFSGDWPALIERHDHDRVVALLSAPERRQNGAIKPGARHHLLTWGVGQCGVCGGRLRVAVKGNQRYGVKKPLYVCDIRGCVGRDEVSVDEFVRAVVTMRLARPDALDWLAGDEDEARRAGERVADLRRRMDEASDACAEGRIELASLERLTARLRPQIEDAEANHRRLLATRSLDVVAAVAGPEAAEAWDAMAVSQRRALVEVLLDRVVIHRASRRGPGFHPDDVEIVWRAG